MSPRTQGPKNYSGPRVFTSYFYFYIRFRAATVEGPYFLLLFLRPFSRSNCRRSLLLTFTFTSVFEQQLSKVLTSYFYFYVRFRTTTAVFDGGDIFGIWRVGEEIWVRFFWAKGLGGSWFLFFLWRGGEGGGGVLGVLIGGSEPK